MSFVVTKGWLETHGTRGCGFNRRQLAALGVAWPPASGWKHGLVGTEISDEARAAFESANPRAKSKPKLESSPDSGYLLAVRCKLWQKRCDRCGGALVRPFYWTKDPNAAYRTICECCHDVRQKQTGVAPWPAVHRKPQRWVGPPCWSTPGPPKLVKATPKE